MFPLNIYFTLLFAIFSIKLLNSNCYLNFKYLFTNINKVIHPLLKIFIELVIPDHVTLSKYRLQWLYWLVVVLVVMSFHSKAGFHTEWFIHVAVVVLNRGRNCVCNLLIYETVRTMSTSVGCLHTKWYRNTVSTFYNCMQTTSTSQGRPEGEEVVTSPRIFSQHISEVKPLFLLINFFGNTRHPYNIYPICLSFAKIWSKSKINVTSLN